MVVDGGSILFLQRSTNDRVCVFQGGGGWWWWCIFTCVLIVLRTTERHDK